MVISRDIKGGLLFFFIPIVFFFKFVHFIHSYFFQIINNVGISFYRFHIGVFRLPIFICRRTRRNIFEVEGNHVQARFLAFWSQFTSPWLIKSLFKSGVRERTSNQARVKQPQNKYQLWKFSVTSLKNLFNPTQKSNTSHNTNYLPLFSLLNQTLNFSNCHLFCVLQH